LRSRSGRDDTGRRSGGDCGGGQAAKHAVVFVVAAGREIDRVCASRPIAVAEREDTPEAFGIGPFCDAAVVDHGSADGVCELTSWPILA
jgi:hypothetical protein